MLENLGTDNFGIYLIAVNCVTAAMFYWDKRSAQTGTWRTAEKTLLGLAAIGGTPAAYWAINKFRHKTKKASFKSQLFIIALLQFFGLLYFGYDTVLLGN